MKHAAVGFAPGGLRGGALPCEVGPDLLAFLARIDTFFLTTASTAGQPYVQHRGGPAGFLKVLDARTLAFADYAGNRQYISVGNLGENARVMLLLIDFETRTRVKIWGRARVVEGDAELLLRLGKPNARARIERAIVIDVDAWDINCRQHITPRVRQDAAQTRIGELQARIAQLETDLAAHCPGAGPRPGNGRHEAG